MMSVRWFAGMLCSMTLLLAALPGMGQDGITTQVELVRKDTASVVPDASEIDMLLLIEAVRGALSLSVEHLLGLCETNYMGFAIPPRTTRKVIGYEDQSATQYQVTNRYRQETVQVPVYKDIYEEYETFAASGGSSTSARDLGKVKRRRRVGREKIGTREVTRLVSDPNGPISKTTTHTRHHYGKPIYADGTDVYQAGVIGANAMVYTVLRKCGVPEDHPAMDNMLKEFERLIESHAIPDYTWDVAWLTAAFCNTTNKRYGDLREWLVAKLVDGQIKEGPGRGFWGPVCIDTVLLPAMLAYEQQLNAERKEAQAKLKERRDDRKAQVRLDAAEAELENYVLGYRYITQQGLRFNDCTSRYQATARPNIIAPINVTGLPYYFFNQALADMESTYLALYAMHEAGANGFLPEQTRRVMTTADQPVASPEKPFATLARMANALASRQHETGQWDSCNTHQPITSFSPFGLPDLLPRDQYELESPVTHLSTVQGFACLLYAGRVVGIDRLFQRYGAEAEKAMNARDEAVLSFLAGQTAGRAFEPYDFAFSVNGLHRRLGSDEESSREMWSRMAFKLVSDQNPDGTWGKGNEVGTVFSSSLLAFARARAERQHEAQQAKLDPSRRTPFNSDAWLRRHSWSSSDLLPAARIKMLMSMLFLLDGVRLPTAAYVPRTSGATAPPPVMAKVLELLRGRDKVAVTHAVIRPGMNEANLTGVPVVFLTSDTDFSDAALARILRQYGERGGTMVAEIATSAQVAALQPGLLGLVNGGRFMPVPEDAPVFSNFIGEKPKLNAISNAKGRPVVYIIPLDTIQASPAVQTAYLLVKDNVESDFFSADYVWKPNDQDATERRLRALPQIKAQAALSRRVGDRVLVTESDVKADTGTVVTDEPASPAAPAAAQPSGPLPDEVW